MQKTLRSMLFMLIPVMCIANVMRSSKALGVLKRLMAFNALGTGKQKAQPQLKKSANNNKFF